MTHRLIAALLLALVIGTVRLHAQEVVTLTTPEAKPSNTQYRISQFAMTPDDPATATVDEGQMSLVLTGLTGEVVNCTYHSTTTPTGTFLWNALNKANLSSAYAANATTGTLKQRIFHRLVVMGEATAVCGKALVGTLAGTVP